jgi:hypothetical protein
MKYKLRAECSHDIAQFIANSHGDFIMFEMGRPIKGLPDVDFVFESKLKKKDIIKRLKEIEGSHVMYQTVEKINKYTGERNYDLL